MKIIYKYVLKIIDEQTLSLPVDATILTAQMQGGYLCLWVLLKDPSGALANIVEDKIIRIVGTGMPIDDSYCSEKTYVATVQMPVGELENTLVWHIFVS